MDLGHGRTKTIWATAQHEKYDKKVPSKVLRFFSAGAMSESLKNTWVAQKKDDIRVLANTLFAEKHKDVEQGNAEEKLLLHCRPQTLCQRTADWFLQKALRLTGTMAGKIVNATDDDDSLSDEAKQVFFDDLIDSWFARHRSTEAMQIGSANKVPVVEALLNYDCIHCFYECGLLEWREAAYIGVSPDGVVLFSPRNTAKARELACVEIKTRSSPNTIAKAEEAAGHCVCTAQRC